MGSPLVPGVTGPELGRCLVMGVVNVTPDSFSDGGVYATTRAAVARGLSRVADGADLVDVGGESTRPGAARVDVDAELARVVPVVTELAAAGVLVSVDTTRAAVASAALSAGAAVVNDVSGGLADPDLVRVVADSGAPYVVMHWRAPSDVMRDHAVYDDVVRDVCDELRQRVDAVVAAGVDVSRVVVDPGLGFAKVGEQNLMLLANLAELLDLGRPLLVGASRKSFLGELLGGRPVSDREDATQAVTTLAALAGAWAVRVHEARPAADAVRTVAEIGARSRR
ncbi:MAG TPA: dihydropteroate synthase [Mycobacteriales bacterium]|nr:dihydropteroate synthase [Mycobacteriales bacterium]